MPPQSAPGPSVIIRGGAPSPRRRPIAAHHPQLATFSSRTVPRNPAPLHAVISNGASRRFFFRFRSCESVGLRREKSLFSSPSSRCVTLESRLSHPERFCETPPPLHPVICGFCIPDAVTGSNGASRRFFFPFRSCETTPPHRHFERSRPICSSAFAPAKASACAERNLSSLRLHRAASPLNRGSRIPNGSAKRRRHFTPSFRTEQADFFFRFRSCESVGLRREKSLFLFSSLAIPL